MSLKAANILLVDDNQSVLDSLKLFLKRKCKQVYCVSNPNAIYHTLQQEEVDLMVLDMNFTTGINNGNEGLFWIQKLMNDFPELVIIPLTAYADIDLAVKAVKLGAFDFLQKPWDNDKLYACLQSAYQLRKAKQNKANRKETEPFNKNDQANADAPIIGDSPVVQEMLKLIHKVAATDASVLILGENGVGKELVARRVHQQSNRGKKVFMSVDLASLSPGLFESEVFGHEKGAFTDAKSERTGKFEAASGGSLFLDEIGNLSTEMQAKLLTVLQERRLSRLGSNEAISIDVRLISATNMDLEAMVTEGSFRQDLLYRMNTIQIKVPALRERKEDIPLLSEYYLKHFANVYKKPSLHLSDSAVNKLSAYSWPGNIRELKHCLERAVILAEKELLDEKDFMFHKTTQAESLFTDVMPLEQGERILIERAIEKCKGNISEAARELGVGRQTLYRKMDRYKLS